MIIHNKSLIKSLAIWCRKLIILPCSPNHVFNRVIWGTLNRADIYRAPYFTRLSGAKVQSKVKVQPKVIYSERGKPSTSLSFIILKFSLHNKPSASSISIFFLIPNDWKCCWHWVNSVVNRKRDGNRIFTPKIHAQSLCSELNSWFQVDHWKMCGFSFYTQF